MKFPRDIIQIALSATLLLALSPNAWAQAQPPAPAQFLDNNSTFGNVPIGGIELVDAEELLRARGGPIRLTLQAQNAPLSEVLARASEQSGLPFLLRQSDATLNRVRVSPAITDASFWVAMRELLTPVEGNFARSYSPDSLLVNSGAPLLPGRSVEVGPLVLSVERIEKQASLSLDATIAPNLARDSMLTVFVNVGYEPRLLANAGLTHCSILEARDDTGAALSLITAPDASDVGVTTAGWNSTQVKLSFRGARPEARNLSVVRGVISVPVWSATEEWRVEDFEALPQEKSWGDQTFRLEKVGKTGDDGRIEAVMVITGKTGFGQSLPTVSLFDKDGRELSSRGQGFGQNSEGRQTQRFYFEGEPKTLVLRTRHSLRRIEVTWEMRDLPLP